MDVLPIPFAQVVNTIDFAANNMDNTLFSRGIVLCSNVCHAQAKPVQMRHFVAVAIAAVHGVFDYGILRLTTRKGTRIPPNGVQGLMWFFYVSLVAADKALAGLGQCRFIVCIAAGFVG